VDLIAGLPFEDYNSFLNSFNETYKLYPHQLQLGFLKLLKGSGIRREYQSTVINSGNILRMRYCPMHT